MRSSAPALADPTVLLHHVDPILDVARRATDGDAFLTEVSDAIGRVIPYDAQTWFGSDPATLFASAPVLIDSIADGHCDSYWAREFLVDDVLLFKDLAIAPTPAGTMRKATDGLPARSARYRGFMQPQGFGDELRLTLRIGSSVWGLGDMFRAEGAEPFSPAEVQLMASLSTPLAVILRSTMLRARSERAIDDGGTGLIVFSMEGELLSLNPHAERWMSELPGTMTDEHPVAVVTILAHALAVDQGHQRGNARLRVLSKSGDWLVLSASPMFGADGLATSIVVVIEPANTSEIMPLLADAYGLSMREQQVTQSLAQGLATGAIARSLHLSEHTVRDHVKAILGKVGVSSRGELIAALFFGHVKERLGSH